MELQNPASTGINVDVANSEGTEPNQDAGVNPAEGSQPGNDGAEPVNPVEPAGEKKETPKGIQKVLAERNRLKKDLEASVGKDEINDRIDQRLAEREAEREILIERSEFAGKYGDAVTSKVDAILEKHPTLGYGEAYNLLPAADKQEINRNPNTMKHMGNVPNSVRTGGAGKPQSLDVLKERASIALKQRGFG